MGVSLDQIAPARPDGTPRAPEGEKGVQIAAAPLLAALLAAEAMAGLGLGIAGGMEAVKARFQFDDVIRGGWPSVLRNVTQDMIDRFYAMLGWEPPDYEEGWRRLGMKGFSPHEGAG